MLFWPNPKLFCPIQTFHSFKEQGRQGSSSGMATLAPFLKWLYLCQLFTMVSPMIAPVYFIDSNVKIEIILQNYLTNKNSGALVNSTNNLSKNLITILNKPFQGI